jgi:hypothetical protein
MPPRAAISNGIITAVILFFMLMLGMLLKARYRLHIEEPEVVEVPKAIPLAIPVEMKVNEARAYKMGDWWVLPKPELVVSRANEADTLRIRSGPKEDVFVLFFVDAAETLASRVSRLREQSAFFLKAPEKHIIQTGSKASEWVSDLLRKHSFVVYTRWDRVPKSERFYAFIKVELVPGHPQDLGELLVRRGYASLNGQETDGLPEALPDAEKYLGNLGKALSLAKTERAGAWSFAP